MSINDIEFWQYFISFALIVFMKIICFILGYLTILLGYKLINSGAKGEFKFGAELGKFKGNLASVSPGLLFVLLGTFLIAYAIFVEKSVEMNYIPKSQTGKSVLSIEKPEILIPDDSLIKSMFENNEEKKNEKK